MSRDEWKCECSRLFCKADLSAGNVTSFILCFIFPQAKKAKLKTKKNKYSQDFACSVNRLLG